MPEQSVSNSNNNKIDVTDATIGINSFNITVVVDGVAYNCESWNDSYSDIYFGDSRLHYDDASTEINPIDVPFLICFYSDMPPVGGGLSGERWIYEFAFADDNSHIVEVKTSNGNVEYHPLDDKFIPETIARTEYVNSSVTQLNNDLVKVSKGYESEVISNCVHTEGIYTIAGLKGFWYKAVDTTNKVIYLTNERTMTEDGIYYTWLNQESEAESLNYSDNAVGKLLSVCNDEKFEYALKITSLEPGKIYYELVGDDDPFKTQEQISVDEVNRDDFSVWCHDCYNEGNVDLGYAAHAEGSESKATNKVAHAEGMYTHAYGQFSHAEGSETRADYAAHAEGRGTEALAVYAHSEGYFTKAIGNGSHAEGKRTTAYASQSHAEGSSSIAMGLRSHAEGTGNVASSQLNGIDLPKLSTSAVRKLWEEAKYTDGDGVEQTATYTDINGVEQTLEVKSLNIAVGESSHVEGSNNLAYGEHSHAEGYRNIAFGVRSHAEGNKTTANGLYSHTEGWYSIANGDYQHVQGKYNIEDTENKYANIIGNGKSLTKRSNAHTVDWNGNAWYAGDVYTGGTGQDDTATKKLATEEYVTQQLTSVNGYKIEVMSESQYANLGVYDASTLYFCYK